MCDIQKNQCPKCHKAFASASGFWYHKQNNRKCYPVAPHVKRRPRKKNKSQQQGSVPRTPARVVPGNLEHLIAKRDVLNPLKIRVYRLGVEEDIQYCMGLATDECVDGASSFTGWDLPEEVEGQHYEGWGVLAGVHVPCI